MCLDSYVILVQDKKVGIGRYLYPVYEEPYFTFSTPKNHEILDKEINDFLLQNMPEILNTEIFKIYSCPKEWSDKAIWGNV